MYALTFDHVTKRYGHNVVLDDVSFVVSPGRVTGFLGPNGAGKSTAMKILLDLAAATSGCTRIGADRYRHLESPARTVGVVLEPNAFHPGRSGRNHLRVLADQLGLPARRVDEVLEMVGLEHAGDRHVRAYSLGMRQRLGLAAALIADPSVLILDEPGNGLDPLGIRWLRELLRRRAADGGTIFVSSHLLAEVEHLADDLVVINRGRLVTAGPLQSLQKQAVTVRCASPQQLAAVLERAGAAVEPVSDGALLVRGLSQDDVGNQALAAGVAVFELAASGSLEDLFLDWTEEQPRTEHVATEVVPV